MIGALGTISGNAKAWNGRLSLPDIFGSAQLPIAESVMSLSFGIVAEAWLSPEKELERIT